MLSRSQLDLLNKNLTFFPVISPCKHASNNYSCRRGAAAAAAAVGVAVAIAAAAAAASSTATRRCICHFVVAFPL